MPKKVDSLRNDLEIALEENKSIKIKLAKEETKNEFLLQENISLNNSLSSLNDLYDLSIEKTENMTETHDNTVSVLTQRLDSRAAQIRLLKATAKDSEQNFTIRYESAKIRIENLMNNLADRNNGKLKYLKF